MTRLESSNTGRSLMALTARLIGAGGFAASTTLLARRLTTAEFGAVALVLSVATAGSIIATAGTHRLLLRDLAAARAVGDAASQRRDLRAAWRVLRLSGPIAAPLTALGTAVVADVSAIAVIEAAGIAVALGAVLVLSDVLRGLGDVVVADLTSGRTGGPATLLLFTAGLLLDREPEVVSALGTYLGALCIVIVITALRARRLLPTAASTGATVAAATVLTASWAFAMVQLALLLNGQVDLWVVGLRLEDTDAGLYGGALRLMAVVSLPLQAVQLAMLPRIAALHATGELDRLRSEVQRTALLAAVPAMAVLLPCVVAPEAILETAFGTAYGDGAFALRALALAQGVNVLSGLCGSVLTMSGNERAMLQVALAGAATTAVASVVGASIGGLEGLAAGSAMGTAAMYVALMWRAHALTGVWTHPWPTARVH